MIQNRVRPQGESSPQVGAVGVNEPDRIIRFVSSINSQMVDDMDRIKELLNARNFTIDYFEYKVISTKTQKRLINLDQKNGPRQSVEVTEKIDINTSLKALRQFIWRIRKDINNVLLHQLNQIKGIPCCLPLFFKTIIQEKHPILISGLTESMMIQLMSKPDLTFKTIPGPIVENKECITLLEQRVERKKGMQTVARMLQDFYGLPDAFKEKIHNLAAGLDVVLTEAESMNAVLLSDLYSRYMGVLQTFQNDITQKNSSVPALASQFDELTQGIKTEVLISEFEDYLVDEDTDNEAFASETNIELFNYLYKQIQNLQEKRVKLRDHELTRADLFGKFKSLVVMSRSQLDPDLWKTCHFFLKSTDSSGNDAFNERSIEVISQKIFDRLSLSHSATSLSLLDIHLIHNIHRQILGRRVLVGRASLSPLEFNIIKSVIIPRYYLPSNQNKQAEGIRLFLEMGASSSKLINSIHTVGRVYGFLVGRRLREASQKFLKPGLRDLLARFGRNFFNIFYEMVVLETGLPVSRNQFADWLLFKGYFKNLENLGYVRNTIEKEFDPVLTVSILSESGDSVFSGTYSQQDFEREYLEKREALEDFLKNLEKESPDKESETDPERILAGFFNTGGYFIRSPEFRSYIKGTYLQKAMVELVYQSCLGIRHKIKELSVRNKVILRLPLEFDPLLCLENIFYLSVDDQEIQIHIIAVPTSLKKDVKGVSAKFIKNFSGKINSPEDEATESLQKFLFISREYQLLSMGFIKYLTLIMFDRQISQSLYKMRQQRSESPNYIKYHFQNYEKLLIGNIKKANLGKLIQYDPKKKDKESFYHMSVREILQAMAHFKSATRKLQAFIGAIEQQQISLASFAQAGKEDYESITYSKQVEKLKHLLSTPVDRFNENLLNIISVLAGKIKQNVDQNMNKKGVLRELFGKMSEENPSFSGRPSFFLPFIKQDVGYDDVVFSEMSAARDLLQKIERRKCIVFFPDKRQKEHTKYIAEIGAFLTERAYNTNMYVEVSTLSKEEIENLSRVFPPKNFFRLDRITPKNR